MNSFEAILVLLSTERSTNGLETINEEKQSKIINSKLLYFKLRSVTLSKRIVTKVTGTKLIHLPKR